MDLRFRGADSQNGLTMEETAFYLAQTGTRTWVHIGCVPCYWEFYENLYSNEYSSPALRSVYTDWEAKISHEFDEWRQLTNHYDMEEFLEKHGYPKEKWMKARITRAVTRFQAIWRGYLYKKAYPVALRQQRVTHSEKTRKCRRNEFLSQNSIGAHMEILFDGLPLGDISTSMTINSTAGILLALYIAVAKRRGIDPKKLRGTIQNDLLKDEEDEGENARKPKVGQEDPVWSECERDEQHHPREVGELGPPLDGLRHAEHVQAGSAPRLRQEHRAELAAADDPDTNGRRRPRSQERVEVHG